MAVDNRNVESEEGLQELETGEGQAPIDLQEINRDQSTENAAVISKHIAEEKQATDAAALETPQVETENKNVV